MVDDALPLFDFAIVGETLSQGFDQGDGAGKTLLLEQFLELVVDVAFELLFGGEGGSGRRCGRSERPQ